MVDTVTIPADRYQRLLKKEQAADAALAGLRDMQTQRRRHSWACEEDGECQLIKVYLEGVARFAAANPPVAADAAATDDLPF